MLRRIFEPAWEKPVMIEPSWKEASEWQSPRLASRWWFEGWVVEHGGDVKRSWR